MLPDARRSPVERVPPHSEEAERGVLGSALLDAERVLDLSIERQISAEAFYYNAHRDLYEVLLDLHTRSQVIDTLTVRDRLRTLNKLEAVGGADFLDKLIDDTPTSAHAEHYIGLVHQKHLLRMVIDRSREAIDKCYHGDQEAELVLAETEEAFFSVTESEKRGMARWPDLIHESVRHINDIFDNNKGTTGVPTGYADIDKLLMGLQPSDMIILAARPSMGKTSLALNIAEHVALGKGAPKGSDPVPVAVFSLEMASEQLVRRMLCSHAQVPYHKLTGGYLSNEFHQNLMDAASKLQDLPIYIDDSAGLDVLDLRARARRLKRKYDIGLIVVDYLQMMHCAQFSREGRQRETAAISNALKSMAKELKIPVLVLSQLSRAPETRDRTAVPKLSDLRDSGSIEQDADVVCLLRRPCKYPDDPEYEDKTLAILDIAKHRNGPTGEIKLNFLEDFTRFQDRTHHVMAPDAYAQYG